MKIIRFLLILLVSGTMFGFCFGTLFSLWLFFQVIGDINLIFKIWPILMIVSGLSFGIIYSYLTIPQIIKIKILNKKKFLEIIEKIANNHGFYESKRNKDEIVYEPCFLFKFLSKNILIRVYGDYAEISAAKGFIKDLDLYLSKYKIIQKLK